jgi:hypothetical protein
VRQIFQDWRDVNGARDRRAQDKDLFAPILPVLFELRKRELEQKMWMRHQHFFKEFIRN